MLNSRFVNAMADRFAGLIWGRRMSVERRIRRAYLIAYGRLPAGTKRSGPTASLHPKRLVTATPARPNGQPR